MKSIFEFLVNNHVENKSNAGEIIKTAVDFCYAHLQYDLRKFPKDVNAVGRSQWHINILNPIRKLFGFPDTVSMRVKKQQEAIWIMFTDESISSDNFFTIIYNYSDRNNHMVKFYLLKHAKTEYNTYAIQIKEKLNEFPNIVYKDIDTSENFVVSYNEL